MFVYISISIYVHTCGGVYVKACVYLIYTRYDAHVHIYIYICMYRETERERERERVRGGDLLRAIGSPLDRTHASMEWKVDRSRGPGPPIFRVVQLERCWDDPGSVDDQLSLSLVWSL